LEPVLVALKPEPPVVNVFDDEGGELEEGLHAITYGDTITLNIAAQADQVRVLANGENMETYDDQTRADNNGRGELPTITDTIEIAPTETTVYAVQARNTIAADVEPNTKTFTVTVRPRIEYFGSNTEAIVAHLTDNLTLQINAPGGARYEIFANDNPEPVAGAISSNPITTVSIAAPTETTEYMLRVYSADGLEAEYPRAAIIPVSYCQIREAAPAGIELLSGPGATYNVVDNDVRGNELILTRESLSPNEEWLRVRVRNQDQAGWVRVEDIDPRSCSLNLDAIGEPAGPIAKVSPGELPPTSTPTFTPIPTPTSTPRPTSTPTFTPRPTATATPNLEQTATVVAMIEDSRRSATAEAEQATATRAEAERAARAEAERAARAEAERAARAEAEQATATAQAATATAQAATATAQAATATAQAAPKLVVITSPPGGQVRIDPPCEDGGIHTDRGRYVGVTPLEIELHPSDVTRCPIPGGSRSPTILYVNIQMRPDYYDIGVTIGLPDSGLEPGKTYTVDKAFTRRP
jgi:hypothetical protein